MWTNNTYTTHIRTIRMRIAHILFLFIFIYFRDFVWLVALFFLFFSFFSSLRLLLFVAGEWGQIIAKLQWGEIVPKLNWDICFHQHQQQQWRFCLKQQCGWFYLQFKCRWNWMGSDRAYNVMYFRNIRLYQLNFQMNKERCKTIWNLILHEFWFNNYSINYVCSSESCRMSEFHSQIIYLWYEHEHVTCGRHSRMSVTKQRTT